MKKFYFLIGLLMLPLIGRAQGWPQNYGGVMLQGFYWDSYTDTQWSNLESQADELSKYFNLIWVPQSGYCNTLTNQMGYAPIWWFDHKSAFGTEAELRSMISAYKAKNVGIIEDVVINHRSGNTNWCDFPTETWNGHTMTWSLADICNGDDGGYTQTQGYAVSGANDTGDDFGGSRDLDHTSANVQQNIEYYLDFLLKDLGYSGFRYDMVKGYSPTYTGIYNNSSNPTYSVGEYWDSSYDNVVNWINGTTNNGSIQSAAFDFPLKYGINSTFGSGNWDISNKGLAASGMSRYSVTFVDNHDTYRNSDKLSNNVLAANAFILALPGTPCIFLPHWQQYKSEIGKMILARKAAGVTNQSSITRQEALTGGYVTVVQGTAGSVMVLSGYPNNFDTTGYTCIASGNNFAYYLSNNIDATAILNDGQTSSTAGEVKIHVNTTSSTAPYLYAWDSANTTYNGAWPGTQPTSTSTTADGKTWYDWTSTVTPINIIFNSGNGQPQTNNIVGVSGERYYTIDPATLSGNIFDYNDVTSAYNHPGCATEQIGKTYAYFEAPASWGSVNAWAWTDGGDNYTGGTWPGTAIVQVGTASNGNKVYRWTYDGSLTTQPASIIFNDGTNQTGNLSFTNGGYYNVKGLLYTVSAPTVTISSVGYATYSYSQAIDFSQTSGITAYTVTSNDGASVHLKQVSAVPANTGVVLQGNQGIYTLVPTSDATEDVSDNLLKATSLTGEVTTDGTFYVLANVAETGTGFYKLADNNKVYANKAYLVYTGTTAAKEFIPFDTTTAVDKITVSKDSEQDAIYSLTGAKMQGKRLPKGIYIVNGKKMVVR